MHGSWPPLIVAAEKPAWMWLRDFLITLVMWTIFVFLLATTFDLFTESYLTSIGLGNFNTEDNWAVFLGRMSPYVLIACALLAALCVAGLMTIRRRRHGLLLEPPDLLDLSDDADRAGMGEGALIEARTLRVAEVHIEPDGSLHVEEGEEGVEGSENRELSREATRI